MRPNDFCISMLSAALLYDLQNEKNGMTEIMPFPENNCETVLLGHRYRWLQFYVSYSPTLTRQPFSSGSRPNWMPVMVSYSFWLSWPISPPLMSMTSST